MKLIVITSPEAITDEVQKIFELFDKGLELLHIRKPDWDSNQVEELIRKIPFTHYKKIVLHSHYKLCEKYNIKGIHLTAVHRNGLGTEGVKELIGVASKRKLSVSTSFHSLKEVQENKLKYNYAFIGPVFDSISKKGYQTPFDKKELIDFLSAYTKSTALIALGGIDEHTLKEADKMKFSGAAVLGAVWENKEHEVDAYIKIKVALANES